MNDMKKFVLTTISESGDNYMYFIEHTQKPTNGEIDEWLLKNGSDIVGGICYEHIHMIVEIDKFEKV
jgi:hypothetical protein